MGGLHEDDYEAQLVRAELRSGQRRQALIVLLSIALAARVGAVVVTPRSIARLHDLEVHVIDGLPPEIPAVLVGGTILVKRKLDARREALAIWHELAHWLLKNSLHAHADVWVLTLLLAAPPWVLDGLEQAQMLSAERLAWDATIPRWAAEERMILAEEEVA